MSLENCVLFKAIYVMFRKILKLILLIFCRSLNINTQALTQHCVFSELFKNAKYLSWELPLIIAFCREMALSSVIE